MFIECILSRAFFRMENLEQKIEMMELRIKIQIFLNFVIPNKLNLVSLIRIYIVIDDIAG